MTTKSTEQYRVKCAEIEGYKHIIEASGRVVGYMYNEKTSVLSDIYIPAYDTDADIDRVVRLLDAKQIVKYATELNEGFTISDIDDVADILQETPEQKRMALMRTLIKEDRE